jgi:alpha-beta hydrolase superfamily lysophospholipase
MTERPNRRRRKLLIRLLAAGFIICVLALNIMAWMHAGAMTRFVPAGTRTAPPEDLSLLQKAKTLATGVTIPRPEGTRTPADSGLGYTTHHFTGSNGHRLEAWHIPGGADDAPLVILLHGYGAWKASLLPTATRLHHLGCAILLVDFFGSGGSSGCETTIGYLEAEDTVAALRHARQRWPDRPVVLYGLSMGGAAALRAVAEKGAAPDGLVVESCFDTLLNTVRARFRAMGLPPTPAAETLVFWGGVRGGFNAFTHNPVDYAARVSCPTLVLHGAHDQRVSPDEARRIHHALTGPKRLTIYHRAGHQPLAETAPGQWGEDMVWLLAEAAGEPR